MKTESRKERNIAMANTLAELAPKTEILLTPTGFMFNGEMFKVTGTTSNAGPVVCSLIPIDATGALSNDGRNSQTSGGMSSLNMGMNSWSITFPGPLAGLYLVMAASKIDGNSAMTTQLIGGIEMGIGQRHASSGKRDVEIDI
jgi:hypothetical protein